MWPWFSSVIHVQGNLDHDQGETRTVSAWFVGRTSESLGALLVFWSGLWFPADAMLCPGSCLPTQTLFLYLLQLRCTNSTRNHMMLKKKIRGVPVAAQARQTSFALRPRLQPCIWLLCSPVPDLHVQSVPGPEN